jgi:hypothetical protein
MNIKQFNSKLNGVLVSAKNIAANIQLLVLFAIEQAGTHGNLTELTSLLVKTKGCRSINSKQLEKFVFAHIDNIEWKSTKNKKNETVKTLVQSKGKKIKVTEPTVSWVDYEVATGKSKATALTKISADSAKKKADDFRARVKATKDVVALQANLDLMKQQVQMLELALKK